MMRRSRRRRRNNQGTTFYMVMSIFCLVILFAGYSFVHNLAESRKTAEDIATISISEDKNNSSKQYDNIVDKIMSYFNIFLQETFKEKETETFIENNQGSIIENKDETKNDIIKVNETEATQEGDAIIYNGEKNETDTVETTVYLANNRKEEFFKVIESPSSRSSVKREIPVDAASINQNTNIVLYHTHGTEAYLPIKEGNYRTQDTKYNVMGLGEQITNILTENGVNITHLKDYNDYPDYNSSYKNSNNAVKQVLSNNKKNILIDLHRDGADENSSYEEFLSRVKSTEINGKTAATFTLVVGDSNGNFNELKQTAQIVYDTANELYPNLCREVVVREGKYFNQYLSDNAMLVEIGSSLNTIEEAEYTADLFAEILIKSIEKINN